MDVASDILHFVAKPPASRAKTYGCDNLKLVRRTPGTAKNWASPPASCSRSTLGLPASRHQQPRHPLHASPDGDESWGSGFGHEVSDMEWGRHCLQFS